MNWLVSSLTRFGFTRDWAGWFWLRLISAAGLVLSLTTDQITYVFNYIGFPITVVWEHRIAAFATLILWIAGKQDRSWLPSTDEKNSVKPPIQKEKP